MSKGGGTSTTTTTQAIDPQIKSLITGNVDRATGIANQGFQAYTGDPYAGLGGTPGTPGSWGAPQIVGYDGDYGTPMYGDPVWNPGTQATPGSGAPFNPNAFVAPLSANQNLATSQAPQLLNAGQNAISAGVNGAIGLLGYKPQNINAATAGTATTGATGYNPALTGDAPQVSGTGYNASLTGDAPQVTASGYNASLLGSAPQMQGVQSGPAAQASFGPANANTINRGSVGNVGANSGLGGIAGYQNPYETQVVNAALNDIELQRQRSLGGNTDAAIAAKAFGGSRQGVADSLTNEAYGRQAAQTAAQLRAAGFDTAAALAQQDASRAQQGQAANQAADLSVAGQNANALNNMGQFNAQGLFGASQFNAGSQNAFSQANADRAQAAGANNQNLLAQYALSNQGAANAAAQYGASAANDASRINAGLLSTNQLANQNAQNAAAQYGATAANDASRINAGLLSTNQLANQNAQNTAGQFGAGAANTAALANMAALNQGGQFNASAINNAQAQNQQAGLAGAGLNANAAGLLGTLGGQQQGMLANGISGLLQTGSLQQGNQQAALDAAYQEFLRSQNYPYVGQSLINQSLGLLPQGGTTTQTAPKPDNTGGILSGLGSLAMAASMFSDGRLKEDLVFDGYDNEGRKWYQYRYIWDEHGMRRRGVIAQDIIESDPHAVHVHPSGYLMVDYSALGRKH